MKINAMVREFCLCQKFIILIDFGVLGQSPQQVANNQCGLETGKDLCCHGTSPTIDLSLQNFFNTTCVMCYNSEISCGHFLQWESMGVLIYARHTRHFGNEC